MKALRLIIYQSSANYRREETVENKMTYPLPPISTVIGALHNACGYQQYKPMDISIQGKYESMHREPYVDYCFLNTLQDDRGILVKMSNGGLLSNAYVAVATAKKPQGNSFRNGVTIQVHNQTLLEEYRKLKDINDQIGQFKKTRLAPVQSMIKKRKKQLSDKKRRLNEQSKEFSIVAAREKEIKEIEKEIANRMKKYQEQKYTIPISSYRSLTKSLKFYEILDGVELLIHVRAEERVLEDILDHIGNLKAIGRSEDMIDVKEAKLVELAESTEEDEVINEYSAYIDCELVKKERVFFDKLKKGQSGSGTKYYLNKNYKIVNSQRIFEKKKVLYISRFAAEEFGDGLYLDKINGKEYIVNFL